jgi:molecular chaperone DnaJ
MDAKGYYKILGLEEKASADDIKKAYRKKVMDCHPDRHPGDKVKEEEFKKVAEAYEILSDEKKRGQYDSGGSWSGEPGVNFEEVFKTFFHGGRSRTTITPEQIVNLKSTISVSLEDYIHSKGTTIRYQRAKQVGEPAACPACGGKGSAREEWYGTFQQVMCGNCGGTGKFIRVRRDFEEATLTLKYGHIQYKCAGMGDVNHDGTYGAVMFVLNFQPTDTFYVDHQTFNLVYKARLTLKEFLEGKQLIIERYGSTFRIQHDNSGDAKKSYRLQGRGLLVNGIMTDLIVEVTPIYPVFLDDKAKEILSQLCEQKGFSEQSQTP